MNDKNRSYKMPTGPVPGRSLDDHLHDLYSLRDFFVERGFRTSNTRIDRYIDYLENHKTNSSTSGPKSFKNTRDPRFKSEEDWLLHVLREIHELDWIRKGMQNRPPEGLNEKLGIILSGHDFAAFDSNTRARDTQYELRLASYFCQAGFRVILSETDVIALMGDYAYFWECKRIANVNQLEKRLIAARTQLQKKMPKLFNARQTIGCIAADVTKAAFPLNGLTVSLIEEQSRDIIQRKLTSIVNGLEKKKLYCENGEPPSIIWYQIHFPVFTYYPQQTLTRFSSFVDNRENLTPQEKLALACLQGLINFISEKDDKKIATNIDEESRSVLGVIRTGTTFGVEDGVIEELAYTGSFSEKPPGTIFGSIGHNGENLTIYFDDLQHLPPAYLAECCKKIKEDEGQGAWHLLFGIYLHKFFNGKLFGS